MNDIVSGIIRTYDEEQRLITLVHRRRIRRFYLQRSLLNHIGQYLAVGRFIQFTITGEPRRYRDHVVDTVDYVIRIMHLRYRKNIVFYDIKDIKAGTRRLVNRLGYKMFLDLEMSMHPYRVDPDFVQEVIQVGYLLVDGDDKEVLRYDQIIQPTRHKTLSKRTLKFLDITQEDVDAGIPFVEFYQHFQQILKRYRPAVIVWGRNDFLALKDAFRINNLPNLNGRTRYINLLKLHKNYYHLKNDLGLFNALSLYEDNGTKQSHNAFEDALVTYRIFLGFRDVLNHKRQVDVSMYK
jgi:sporulation inhibitor KapD